MIAMKLQRQVAYRYKEKIQYKHVIVIPNGTIKKLDWKVGEELENSIDGKTLTIKPKSRE